MLQNDTGILHAATAFGKTVVCCDMIAKRGVSTLILVDRAGRDDIRMELMERLRKAGFEIRLVEDNCEHYAVIDKEIVWYGSMNLLSKEDADDNLMRVCSKDIAAELLEMTFGNGKEIQNW